jgi:hypothetical protein
MSMHLEMNGFGAPGLHNGRKEIVFYVYLCELLKFKCSVYLRQYIFINCGNLIIKNCSFNT